ncbi:MAG: glycosyltransferase family 4 protein [Candidatus Omnitrophota bacterium]
MQRFNEKLVAHLRKKTQFQLLVWGGSQIFLPFFVFWAFLRSSYVCLWQKIACIYVSDGLLSPLGVVLKYLFRKPLIVTIHGKDAAFSFILYQKVLAWSLKNADRVICVSQELKEACLQKSVPLNKIEVIPNGVDVEDFNVEPTLEDIDAIEKKIGQSLRGRRILLTVGRLISKKGVDSFILNILPRILEKNRNLLYLIVGDGPLKRKIQNTIDAKEWNDYVHLFGSLPMGSHLLKKIYALSDIFVMPNVPVVGDIEGFGIVALEAAASGLPVVASAVDGITDAIRDRENGFLIEYDQYGAFAEKIIEMLGNDSYRKSCGLRAREFVKENYSWQSITQRYFQLFEDIGKG